MVGNHTEDSLRQIILIQIEVRHESWRMGTKKGMSLKWPSLFLIFYLKIQNLFTIYTDK